MQHNVRCLFLSHILQSNQFYGHTKYSQITKESGGKFQRILRVIL